MVMKVCRILPLLVAIFSVTLLSGPASGQSSDPPEIATPAAVPSSSLSTSNQKPPLAYARPSEETKLHSYAFDVIGPYPILGAAFAAGINQSENTPPEWKQGAEGYGKRFGSDFAIAAITTTTRYGLAEAFREDTVYYRCECTGILP